MRLGVSDSSVRQIANIERRFIGWLDEQLTGWLPA